MATGTSIQSTTFKVPFGAPVGSSELVVIANGIASNIAFVDVKPFRFWIIPNYEIAARLIGSLADGPLWVLGPNGPVPVDPWGPKYIQPAKEAYASIMTAIKNLERIGEEISAQQIKENAANRLPVRKEATEVGKKAAAK
ncbi:MAG: hypothetical protein WCG81_13445 [Candidatus Angelobacter sp.]